MWIQKKVLNIHERYGAKNFIGSQVQVFQHPPPGHHVILCKGKKDVKSKMFQSWIRTAANH
jgi:predicted RNA binding protein YcfA (HicA-like mRNA interferase family)